MAKVYFTIVGMNHHHGYDFLKSGMKVKLVKEPDNSFDKEAIRVEMNGMGLIGYVANSIHTVKGESMSAGRLYDRIGKKAEGTVQFITPFYVIGTVKNKDLK